MPTPQLIQERRLIEQNEISSDDCKRALDALHAVEVVPVSNSILDYLTTSDRVLYFLEEEIRKIQGILGKSLFKIQVVVGGFGAGKTHVKTYLSKWLNSLGDDVINVSFRIPGEYKEFNFFEEILSFSKENTQQYSRVYSLVNKRLHENEKNKVNENIFELVGDILTEGLVTNRKLNKYLISRGVPSELSEAISFDKSNEQNKKNDNAESIKDCLIGLAKQDGLLAFNSAIEVLNEANFKGLCIFVDDFQNLEKRSWIEHSDAFATQLAQFHEALAKLFDCQLGISVYLMILVQGRFWEGGSEENPGFKHLASSEKLMQHWESSVFELGEFSNDEEILSLTRKVLALYEIAGINLSNEIVEKLEDSQEVRNVLEQQPLVPRKIIQTILNIVDKSINTPWS